MTLIKYPRSSRLPWFENPVSGLDRNIYAAMVKSVNAEMGRFRFGASINEISSRYNFVSTRDAAFYFENLGFENPSLLSDVDPKQPLDTLVVNLQSGEPYTRAQNTGDVFKQKATGIASQIASATEANIRIIVGPTGSGKTAFSKGLFTAGLSKFWEQKVIPSRIEYRWSSRDGIKDLSEYMFWAATRDLLIYLVTGASSDEFNEAIAPISKHRQIEAIQGLRKRNFGTIIEDNDPWLSNISNQIHIITSDLKNTNQQAGLVEHCIASLGLRFLFSFDGFDAISPLEIFTASELSEPVARLVNFLNRNLIDRRSQEVFLCDANAHFLIYVRDTTLRILQRKITNNTVGKSITDFDWVCPPSYRTIATIITRRLCNKKFNATIRNKFVSQIVESLKHHIRLASITTENRVISTSFSWNTRNMKAHFGRLFLILFNRFSHQNLSFEKLVEERGVSRDIIEQFVRHHTPLNIIEYELGRSLIFQDITKEVGTKLDFGDAKIETSFDEADYDAEFFKNIKIREDDGSIGDIVFNCFFDQNSGINQERFIIAPLYILARLANSDRGYLPGSYLLEFLENCGFFQETKNSGRIVEFLLSWLTACRMITPMATIDNPAPLSRSYRLSSSGEILLRREAFRVSYLDSATFTAYWPSDIFSSGGFEANTHSFPEALVVGVSNACHIMYYLAKTEADIANYVRINCPIVAADQHIVFQTVRIRILNLIAECNAILSAGSSSDFQERKDYALQKMDELQTLGEEK